jgi:uncharacterized membrane protein HdeD (DUF308 family)
MIEAIMGIIAGLVLLTGVLPLIPAFGKHLEKLAKWLGGFQTIIGIIAIIVGILSITSLLGIALVLAGLILAIGILPAIPALGKHLEKLAKAVGGFQTIIGIIVLILAIWALL